MLVMHKRNLKNKNELLACLLTKNNNIFNIFFRCVVSYFTTFSHNIYTPICGWCLPMLLLSTVSTFCRIIKILRLIMACNLVLFKSYSHFMHTYVYCWCDLWCCRNRFELVAQKKQQMIWINALRKPVQ